MISRFISFTLLEMFARVLKFLILLLVLQTFLIAGERDEMDQLLQKELGQEPTKQLTEDNKKPTDKKNEPINPVEERYRREDDSSSLLWTLVKDFFV
ncbi:MAG TPA: hypothetical protein PLS71_18030, partial [Leptospiraceae bacterium]|nr:hypothetical protein [Leptospiraceae bacterium]